MNKICFLLLLLCSVSVHAQTHLSGTVYDAKSKQPIPFAMIGVQGKSIGTLSDEAGNFQLQKLEGRMDEDTVAVICLGYKTQKYRVSALNGISKEFFMEPIAYELDEIVVRPGKVREQKIGIANAGTGLFATPLFLKQEIKQRDYLGREVGTTLYVKHKSKVRSLNIHIAQNGYDTIRMRAVFYQIKEGLPADILVNKEIRFDIVNRKLGWFTTDLTPYDIELEGDTEIAVTLMSLDEADRSIFFISGHLIGGKNDLLRRDQVMGPWNRLNFGISLYLGVTSYVR